MECMDYLQWIFFIPKITYMSENSCSKFSYFWLKQAQQTLAGSWRDRQVVIPKPCGEAF